MLKTIAIINNNCSIKCLIFTRLKIILKKVIKIRTFFGVLSHRQALSHRHRLRDCVLTAWRNPFINAEFFEGLMIQQWKPIPNKKIHSYIAKLFPLGIT